MMKILLSPTLKLKQQIEWNKVGFQENKRVEICFFHLLPLLNLQHKILQNIFFCKQQSNGGNQEITLHVKNNF